MFENGHCLYKDPWTGRAVRSIVEAKNSNLVILPGVGAFEQLFGPLRGEFEQKFSKNSNVQGFIRGGCRSFDLTGTLAL